MFNFFKKKEKPQPVTVRDTLFGDMPAVMDIQPPKMAPRSWSDGRTVGILRSGEAIPG